MGGAGEGEAGGREMGGGRGEREMGGAGEVGGEKGGTLCTSPVPRSAPSQALRRGW